MFRRTEEREKKLKNSLWNDPMSIHFNGVFFSHRVPSKNIWLNNKHSKKLINQYHQSDVSSWADQNIFFLWFLENTSSSTLPWTKYSFIYKSTKYQFSNIGVRHTSWFIFLVSRLYSNSSTNELLVNGNFEQISPFDWTYSGSISSSVSHSYRDGFINASSKFYWFE